MIEVMPCELCGKHGGHAGCPACAPLYIDSSKIVDSRVMIGIDLSNGNDKSVTSYWSGGSPVSIKNDLGLIEKFKDLEKVGSAKVTILHDQVIEIVVADLIRKYKACKQRNDEYASSFEKVLSFYLDESEMKEIEQI